MTTTKGVIDKATGNLLRAGNSDFDQQEEFDPQNEEFRTDVPKPPRIFHSTDGQYHQWTGSAWQLVDHGKQTEPRVRLTNTQGEKVTSIQFFETDNGNETYSGLSYEIVYEYQGNKLVAEEEIHYYGDGAVKSRERQEYFEDRANNRSVRKPA